MLGGVPFSSASSAAMKLMSRRSRYEPGLRLPVRPSSRARHWKKKELDTMPRSASMSPISPTPAPFGTTTRCCEPSPALSPLKGWNSEIANHPANASTPSRASAKTMYPARMRRTGRCVAGVTGPPSGPVSRRASSSQSSSGGSCRGAIGGGVGAT